MSQEKLKIVRIIARLNVGGPARHVVWLTDELNNDEFSSVLIAGTVPEGEGDMSYFADEHSVTPIYIPEMSRELSPKDIISLWKVFRELRRQRPDIIHTHTAKAGTIGRVAGLMYRFTAFAKVKVVHTYHGHIFHSYYGAAKTKLFLMIEKTLAMIATDRIIAITQQQFEEIHGVFGVGREKQFEVVKLGIDLKPFENAQSNRELMRNELGTAADEILVGLVGRLTEVKNHSLFLNVAKLYLEQRTEESPKLRFVIIGDGNLRDQLHAEALSLGLSEVVTFMGNRDDADVFYPALDIVALTSLNEGTPLSLIEGMANSRAVISTAVGGVVDLLGAEKQESDGFTVCERGLKVPVNEPQPFLNGVIFLASNREFREESGSRGKQFVFGNYSKEALVKNLKNLYLELVR